MSLRLRLGGFDGESPFPLYRDTAPAGGGASYADTFDRTDGNLSGSTSSDSQFTWTEVEGTDWEVLSNQAQCVNIPHDTYHTAVTSADTNTDNAFAEFVITNFNRPVSHTLFVEVFVRCNSDHTSGYALSVGADATPTIGNTLYRLSDDAPLDTDASTDVSGGGTLRIEVNGSSIVAKWNGSEFMSATDSNEATGVGNRRAAIAAYGWGVAELEDIAINNFAYGDL